MNTAVVPKTFLIVAGGTGGHIFPALAVAKALTRQGHTIVWLGTADRMEADLIPKEGLPIEFVRFGGVRGKGWASLLALPWRLLRALRDCAGVLQRVRPDAVVAFGGYVSFPAGLVARLRGVPLVIHEQNAVAGSANRALARVAQLVLTAFPGVLPGGLVVGNPVRESIGQVAEPDDRYHERLGRPLRLLVVGGSLGAQALNEVVPLALSRLPFAQRPEVLHQSGAKHIAALQARYAEHQVQAQVVPFIADMASAYAEADLVIARAGAMTVFELAAVGVPAILVPFPHAIDDHQTANAHYLVDADAAWLLPQSALTVEALVTRLMELDRDQLLVRARRARQQGRPDAAQQVAELCEQVALRLAVAAPRARETSRS